MVILTAETNTKVSFFATLRGATLQLPSLGTCSLLVEAYLCYKCLGTWIQLFARSSTAKQPSNNRLFGDHPVSFCASWLSVVHQDSWDIVDVPSRLNLLVCTCDNLHLVLNGRVITQHSY